LVQLIISLLDSKQVLNAIDKTKTSM